MCEFCLSHIHKIDIRQAATDEFSGGACTLFGQIYHLADNGSKLPSASAATPQMVFSSQ